MRIKLICIAVLLGIQPLTADEATNAKLIQKIEILERELAILNEQVAASKVGDKILTSPKEGARGEIVINVAIDGRIVAAEKIMEDAELVERLQAVNAQYEDQPLIIRGHAETKFRDIVRVIELCHKAGSWVISFSTTNEETKPDMATPRNPSD